MNLKYSELDSKQMAVANKAIEIYTEWLNHYHEENNETYSPEPGKTEPVRVKREWFFEYSDEPILLMDSGGLVGWYRVMAFRVDPYHDEGGPTVLYCFTEEGNIRAILQEFDLSFNMILDEGKLQYN